MVEVMSESLIEQPITGESGNFPGEFIEPIGQARQALVVEKTRYYVARAEQIYQKKFSPLPIQFDLSGSSAGMYKVWGRQHCIRYNPWIFAKYFDENLEGTVPHEVAHFAVDQTYRRSSVKPHGIEWQRLMHEFDANAEVTFNLDLTGIPQRKQRRHRYRCGCQEHMLSSTRHNRALRRKGIYHCVNCGEKLLYTPMHSP
jgi:SprT protein